MHSLLIRQLGYGQLFHISPFFIWPTFNSHFNPEPHVHFFLERQKKKIGKIFIFISEALYYENQILILLKFSRNVCVMTTYSEKHTVRSVVAFT